jgi:hypothetical protein
MISSVLRVGLVLVALSLALELRAVKDPNVVQFDTSRVALAGASDVVPRAELEKRASTVDVTLVPH